MDNLEGHLARYDAELAPDGGELAPALGLPLWAILAALEALSAEPAPGDPLAPA